MAKDKQTLLIKRTAHTNPWVFEIFVTHTDIRYIAFDSDMELADVVEYILSSKPIYPTETSAIESLRGAELERCEACSKEYEDCTCKLLGGEE